MTDADAGAATYAYAVTRGLDASRLDGSPGVSDQPVRAIEHAGFTALVSTVGLDEFGEDALHRNLEDLGWLEATARAHHAVVEKAGAVTPTVPLRLATVYHSDERVRAMLTQQQAPLAEALSRIEGCTEWGIKAYADPESFTAESQADTLAASGSGKAYLQKRRNQHRNREEAGRAATERAEDIHAAFADIAVASRRHPPQSQQLSGHAGWMILNGAYLVDETRTEEIQAMVAEFSEQPGVELELTGPWVPYSFASPDEEP